MRKTYHAIVEFEDKSKPPKIKKISVPDLDVELSVREIAENKLEQIYPDVTKFIETRIEKRIQDIYRANQVIPEPRYNVAKLKKENQIALEIVVDVEEVRKGFFARFLPGTGFALNVCAALSGIVINVVQMQLAMGDTQDSKSDTALAILQAVMNNSVGILFYVYLKSGQGLEKIGVKLDDFLQGKKPAFDVDKDILTFSRSRCRSTKIILMNILMTGGAIALQVGNASALMASLKATEDEANQSGNSLIPVYCFNIAKWTFTICANTVGLIMTGTILKQLSQDIQNYLVQDETTRMTTNAIAKIREKNLEIQELEEIKTIQAEAVAALNQSVSEIKKTDNSSCVVVADNDSGQVVNSFIR